MTTKILIAQTVLSTVLLAGCQTGNASHIPAPWQLPGAAIGSIYENATYGTRRRKVERFVAQNYGAIMQGLSRGGGPALTDAMNISRIAPERRGEFIHEISSRPDIYLAGPRAQNIERLVVSLMVYGG